MHKERRICSDGSSFLLISIFAFVGEFPVFEILTREYEDVIVDSARVEVGNLHRCPDESHLDTKSSGNVTLFVHPCSNFFNTSLGMLLLLKRQQQVIVVFFNMIGEVVKRELETPAVFVFFV